MADRYWILGTGTWDATNTANWSASSGGTGGASVPTAADNVFFNVNSNVGTDAFTVTMATTPRVCNDFTASGIDGTMTLAGTGIGLTVSGSLTWPATGFSRTYTGTTTFNATTTGKTVTTNGVAFGGAVTFNGVGGAWTLGSAISTTNVSLGAGTFSTANYTVTLSGSLTCSGTAVQVLNLGSSTININSNVTISATNLTLNAGTSSITATSFGSVSISGQSAPLTFYNVALNYTYGNSISTNVNLTFNNLSRSTTIGNYYGLTLSSGFTYTVNGTFSYTAPTNNVALIESSNSPVQATINAAAVSLNIGNTFIAMRGIAVTGASAPWTAARLGDAGFNSGITFTAAKNVYWVGGSGGTLPSATRFSLSSGGTPTYAAYPMPQDTLIFDNNSFSTDGSTLSVGFGSDNTRFGAIDFSGLTKTITFTDSGSNSIVSYGNITWSNLITWGAPTVNSTILRTWYIISRGVGNIVITLGGGTFQDGLNTNAYGTDRIQFADTFTQTTITGVTNPAIITHTSGTLDINNQTVSTQGFSSSNSNTRTIAFGTGNITCTGTGTVWTTSNISGLTTTGTQVVNVTSVGSTAITVTTGALSEANSISYNFTGGTYALTFLATSSNTARNVSFTGYAGTWGATSAGVIYGNLTLSTGMTLTASANTMTFGATSGTRQITTNAKTIDFPLTFNGVGGAWQLQDAMTLGATRRVGWNAGTTDLNGFTLTAGIGIAFNTTSSRNITFNSGSLILVGSGTSAWSGNGSNFTTTAGTGTGTISMTAATAKTFDGNGFTYNCTLNQGGAGALTIIGSNTFSNITNTVQPASVLFTAGTTNTFSNFSLSGTAGNLITIGSDTAASHTLSKASGTVNSDYLSISRSTATGGATWNATNSTDGGNNSGWAFTAPPAPTYSVSGPSSIGEGGGAGFIVTTTNVANGTTLYWTLTPTSGATSADFSTTSGSFPINSNSGFINVNTVADLTTEGTQGFFVSVRTGSISGTVVQNSNVVSILDTSLTPASGNFLVFF